MDERVNEWMYEWIQMNRSMNEWTQMDRWMVDGGIDTCRSIDEWVDRWMNR